MSGWWDQPGVPHKGWTIVGVEDLGPDPADWQTCEMCQARQIRYAHGVEHPRHDGLNVGGECAAKMSEDYVEAKEREKVLRSRAARRAKWLTRSWRISRLGNPFLNVSGKNIVIIPDQRRAGHWGYVIAIRDSDKHVFGERTYPSLNEAKLAAFDLLWPARLPVRRGLPGPGAAVSLR